MMNMVTFVVVVVLAFLQITPPASAAADDGRLDLWPARDEVVKWAGYGEEKLSTVVIAGRIHCNSNPVTGARVAVMCGKGRKGSLGSTETDASGKFVIDLPSHLHAIPNLEKVCHVRVLQLPQPSPCRRRRRANQVHNKPIHLQLASLDQGLRTYTTHNIHLTLT